MKESAAAISKPGWFRAFRTLPTLAAILGQQGEYLRDLSRIVSDAVRKPPASPPAFVSVLWFGNSSRGPAMLGASMVLELGKPNVDVHQVAQLPMTEVWCVVLCDVSRVKVTGIFYGVDLVHLALGDCPIARFPKWEPGVKSYVMCELREGAR